MDLRSLNIFIQVAELGSFTRAGEKLGYSQPTISFQIKQLERELNVQLFERIGHTVSLTEDGGTALVHAQQIIRKWYQARTTAGKPRASSAWPPLILSVCPWLPAGSENFGPPIPMSP